MSSLILFRRGLETNRTSVTPAEGEPLYTTDDQNLFVGDGSTAGGILVGNSSVFAQVFADGDGDIGVGTSTPDSKLHVFRSDTTVVPDTDADDFMIEGTGTIGMTIASTTTGIINFGDAADSDIGAIEYSHSEDSMTIRVNASPAIYINSSGEVGIGETSLAGPILTLRQSNPELRIIDDDSASPVDVIATLSFWNADSNEVGHIGYETGSNAHLTIQNNVSGGDLIISLGSPSTEYFFFTDDGFLGIGATPTTEALEVSGAIILGDANGTTNGTIRYTGSDFEGRVGGSWESLTGGGGGNTIYTADDSLSGDRTVTMTSNDLTFSASTGTLFASRGSSGATATTQTADTFVIEDDLGTGMSILTPNTASGSIHFGDSDDNDVGRIVYSHSNDRMTFYAGGASAGYVDSSGFNMESGFRVNTTEVQGLANFQGGSSGATVAVDANNVVVSGNSFAGISILTPATGTGNIFFGDPGDNNAGRIIYTHTNDRLSFVAGGATAGYIDSSGFNLESGFRVNTTEVNGIAHISAASSGATANTLADELVISSNTFVGLSILCPNTADGSIYFGDAEDNDTGRIRYDHTDDTLDIYTGATLHATFGDTEALTLTSAIVIGDANGTTNGTIRYTGTAFEGRAGGAWISFSDNLYTGNGTITGNRTVTMGSVDLSFSTTTGAFSFGTGSPQLVDQFTIQDDGSFSNSNLFIYNTGDDAVISFRGSTDGSNNGGITHNASTMTLGGAGRQVRLVNTFGGRMQVAGLSAKSSPEATIHIVQEDTGASPVFGHFCIESTDATVAIEMLGSTSHTDAIHFGDPDDIDIGRITYTHSSNAMHFYVSAAEALRIQSDGSVATDDSMIINAISTTPLATLHVRTANTSTTPTTDADDLFVEATGNAGITIGSSASFLGSLNFGDSADADIGRITYSHSSNSMQFFTNASEAMRIESSGEVAIGTTSADGLLHVFSGNSFGTADSNASEIIIEASANGGMSILTGNTSQGAIYFGDFTDVDVGQIVYNHSSNYMAFTVNASERMRIDSSGRLAIGDTTAEARLHVRTDAQTGTVAANGDELLLESTGNTGLSIRSGNTSFGSILFADDGSNNIGRIRYNHNTNRLQFFTNGTEHMRIAAGAMWILDGVTAPGNTSGWAKIYVDTSDGDLKVVFGDGTVKTIVTDT